MSAFDATVRVGEIHIEVTEDERGKKYAANLVMGILTLAPVGPNQVLPIPIGALRAPLDKKVVGELLKGLQSAYDEMDEHSDIAIASDLSAVERAGQLR